MSDREYPDIEFLSTDGEELINSMITAYEKITGRTLYPADPARLFVLWVADIVIQLRGVINESAKQNVPRYAKGEYLDSLGELFRGVQRLSAQKAKTTLRFTISTPQTTSILIPVGTRATTVDGSLVFETVDTIYITAGETAGTVAAQCLTSGTVGNGLTPGQICRFVGNPFSYFESVVNITTTAGGSDDEGDAAYYLRMRETAESYSVAGPAGAYEYFAKSANSGVTSAKAVSPTPGEVVVHILMSGGDLPENEALAEVSKYLSADNRRPLTDQVTVSPPGVLLFDVDLTYWIQEDSSASAEIIEADVDEAVGQYIAWQISKIGRDINPSHLAHLVMGAGAKRVEIRSPVFAVVENTEVAQLASRTVLNGGLEVE